MQKCRSSYRAVPKLFAVLARSDLAHQKLTCECLLSIRSGNWRHSNHHHDLVKRARSRSWQDISDPALSSMRDTELFHREKLQTICARTRNLSSPHPLTVSPADPSDALRVQETVQLQARRTSRRRVFQSSNRNRWAMRRLPGCHGTLGKSDPGQSFVKPDRWTIRPLRRAFGSQSPLSPR